MLNAVPAFEEAARVFLGLLLFCLLTRPPYLIFFEGISGSWDVHPMVESERACKVTYVREGNCLVLKHEPRSSIFIHRESLLKVGPEMKVLGVFTSILHLYDCD